MVVCIFIMSVCLNFLLVCISQNPSGFQNRDPMLLKQTGPYRDLFDFLGPFLFFMGNVDSVCTYTALRKLLLITALVFTIPFDMFSIFVGTSTVFAPAHASNFINCDLRSVF